MSRAYHLQRRRSPLGLTRPQETYLAGMCAGKTRAQVAIRSLAEVVSDLVMDLLARPEITERQRAEASWKRMSAIADVFALTEPEQE